MICRPMTVEAASHVKQDWLRNSSNRHHVLNLIHFKVGLKLDTSSFFVCDDKRDFLDQYPIKLSSDSHTPLDKPIWIKIPSYGDQRPENNFQPITR